MVPEYFLFDYPGLRLVATTRGQQEQAQYENMMLDGRIGPPFNLHQDTDTHTQTQIYYLHLFLIYKCLPLVTKEHYQQVANQQQHSLK